jgi:hypothetical protein
MVLPCDNLLLRSEASQRPTRTTDNNRLAFEVERALADFLEREVSMHVKLEVIKQQMIHRPDYTNLNAFNCIDCTNEGVLTHRNIA